MAVVIEGDLGALKKTLKNLGELEYKKINKAIGEIIKSSTVERFNAGKSPDDKPWVQSQNSKETGRKTLLVSSRLRNSIHPETCKKGVAVGTNTIYAATHQFGAVNREIKAKTSRGLIFKTSQGFRRKQVVRVTIPARPFLGINDNDIAEIKATIMDALKETTQ